MIGIIALGNFRGGGGWGWRDEGGECQSGGGGGSWVHPNICLYKVYVNIDLKSAVCVRHCERIFPHIQLVRRTGV